MSRLNQALEEAVHSGLLYPRIVHVNGHSVLEAVDPVTGSIVTRTISNNNHAKRRSRAEQEKRHRLQRVFNRRNAGS